MSATLSSGMIPSQKCADASAQLTSPKVSNPSPEVNAIFADLNNDPTEPNRAYYANPAVPHGPFSLLPEFSLLQRLSLHGFHFQDSTMLTLPSNMPLKSLVLTNCNTFRLAHVKIEVLVLENCENVFLNTLPTAALKVNKVKFRLFAGSKIPKSLKVLQLEETSVNTLNIPKGLLIFNTRNVECESLHFVTETGTQVLTQQQIDLKETSVSWVKSKKTPSLWLTLSTQLPDVE